MNPNLLQLALDKQRLQLQCAAQRDAIAVAATGVAPLLAAVDAVRKGIHWLADNPVLVAGVTAGFVIARPRPLARWVRRGVVAWQAWQRVRQWRVENPKN